MGGAGDAHLPPGVCGSGIYSVQPGSVSCICLVTDKNTFKISSLMMEFYENDFPKFTN